MDAVPGAPMKKLTTWTGTDQNPQWSPDGKYIAYMQSSSNENFTMYGEDMLELFRKMEVNQNFYQNLVDRNITNIRWSKDGRYIATTIEDDRQSNIVAFDVASGNITKLAGGDTVFASIELNRANGNWITLMSTPHLPFELFALENGNTRRLTYVQDSFLAPLQLPIVEGFKSKSKDGTIVSGILYKPFDSASAKKLPLVLYIHGGPVGQDDYSFDIISQIISVQVMQLRK